MTWLRLLLLAIVLGVSSTGCVSKPVVELHSASIYGAGPLGVAMIMVMKVNNKNVFDVQVRNVRANIVIAERFRMPTVVYNPNQWLAAGRSTLVQMPVTVPWAMIGPLLATTVGSATIGYRVTGLVDVTAVRMLGIRSNDEQIDEEGSVSRMELVIAAGRGMGGPAMQ